MLIKSYSQRQPHEGFFEAGLSEEIFLLELDWIAASSKNTEAIPVYRGEVYVCSSSAASPEQGEVMGPSGSPVPSSLRTGGRE